MVLTFCVFVVVARTHTLAVFIMALAMRFTVRAALRSVYYFDQLLSNLYQAHIFTYCGCV